jgi:hypothetical protein
VVVGVSAWVKAEKRRWNEMGDFGRVGPGGRSHWHWAPVTRLLTAPVTNREGSYGGFFSSKPKE